MKVLGGGWGWWWWWWVVIEVGGDGGVSEFQNDTDGD